jgi:hypothetical protein
MTESRDKASQDIDDFHSWQDDLKANGWVEVEDDREGLEPDAVPNWVRVIPDGDGDWMRCAWVDNLGELVILFYYNARTDITTEVDLADLARYGIDLADFD